MKNWPDLLRDIYLFIVCIGAGGITVELLGGVMPAITIFHGITPLEDAPGNSIVAGLIFFLIYIAFFREVKKK